MTQKEQTRLQVLNSVLADQVVVCQAAEVLGVSERHTRRILAAYRKEGAAALAHGNRGRRPANTTTETKMTYVVQLARTRYAGTNHTHLTELLMEREGIDLSRSTVRRILVSAGVDSPRRRRPPRHRVRRKRMAQEGMLLQIDGSHHRWLGEQGPRFVLLLAVDDATGTVPDALFSQEEDTRGYFLLMEGLIRQCGIPLAVYSDRHAVFKHTGEVGQKPAGPTQFARAMEELGIRQIFARSPQAKGRVERTAGTFQDRLVTELRLAGVTTIDEANEVLHRFLPRFTEKFGVPAEHSSVAYRSMESSVSLDQILCFKHRRKVARDNTVKYNWRTLQLLPGKERPSYAGAQLEVHDSASSTAARWPGTTPSSTTGVPCSCCLVRSGLATPERSWRSMRAWTVSSSCSTGDARSPHRRRRRALEFSVPPMVLSDMAPALSVGSTAWAATPRRAWHPSTPSRPTAPH